MNSMNRRAAILKLLQDTQEPITGGQLSEHLGVTRQVIVSDIALLRAQGEDIIGTPRGYLYNRPGSKTMVRQKIASVHSRFHDQIRDELYLIVDHGASVQDVIVEHPVYGEITASLHISSRYDVDQFLEKLAEYNAEPLLILTDGPHLHTIEADRIEVLEQVKQALAAKGYLAPE